MAQLNINNFKKKYIIKVPEEIKVIYCNHKNILVLQKATNKKYLKLDVKILLIPEENIIVVTSLSSWIFQKKIKKLQGTTAAKIKMMLIEMSYTLFTKLVLVGVGYKVFSYEKVYNQIYFKLGYSHLIYFSVPKDLTVFCLKSTKIFLYGNTSYNQLTHTASQIRSYKIPEVYKGKGILYDQENIILKKGKKV